MIIFSCCCCIQGGGGGGRGGAERERGRFSVGLLVSFSSESVNCSSDGFIDLLSDFWRFQMLKEKDSKPSGRFSPTRQRCNWNHRSRQMILELCWRCSQLHIEHANAAADANLGSIRINKLHNRSQWLPLINQLRTGVTALFGTFNEFRFQRYRNNDYKSINDKHTSIYLFDWVAGFRVFTAPGSGAAARWQPRREGGPLARFIVDNIAVKKRNRSPLDEA